MASLPPLLLCSELRVLWEEVLLLLLICSKLGVGGARVITC